MLTPDYLQGAPEEIEGLFQRLEREIISDICRRIAKAASITDTAQHEIIRMKELGAGTDYIKKKIKEISGLSEQAVDRLFFDAAQTSSDFYADVYARANVPYVPYEYNDFFQQLTTSMINQTRGELVNITQSIGFSYMGANGIRKFYPAAKAYHDTLDYAVTQVSTGMTDYITAIRNATRRLTDSGLQYVDYESGVRTRADVAARRAVLTGLSQMTGRVAEHNMRELDTDIVEVTAHSGARPDHAEWQGRWYSFSGKSKDYPSLVEVTGYGTGAGLKGWNCRHDFYPVIPGISQPTYTEEELRNIDPPPIEYRGRKYDAYAATQKQRAMERGIRQTKRELLAAEAVGDKDMFDAKSVLLRRQREEYTKFSDKAGLLPQNERTQVDGFGRSQGSKAAWAAKKAQSAKKGGGSSGGTTSSGSGGQAVAVAVPWGSNGGAGKVYRDQRLDKSGGSGIIYGEPVQGGVGAKSSSYPIVYYPGTDVQVDFVVGSRPQYPPDHTMAGKNCKTHRQIDDIDRLVDTYNCDASNWQKEKARYEVYDEYGEIRVVELHWYQHPDIGKVEYKVKTKGGYVYVDEWD